MSSPTSIYVLSIWSFFIYSLIFIIINHTISLKQAHFLEYLILVLKKVDHLQIAKVQPEGAA